MKLYQAGSCNGERFEGAALGAGGTNFMSSFATKMHRTGTVRHVRRLNELSNGVVIHVPDELGIAFLSWLDSRPATVRSFEEFLALSK